MDPDRTRFVYDLRKRLRKGHGEDVLAGSAKTSTYSALAVLSMLILHIVLTRFLSPSEYAVYGTYISILLTFLIAFGSIYYVIAHFISYHDARLQYEQITYLLKHSMKWMFALGFVFFVLFAVFSTQISDFFQIPEPTSTVLLGFVVWFTILTPVFEGAFKGLQIPGPLGRMRLIEAVSRLAFCLLFVWVGFGVSGVILGLGLGTVVALAASYVFILRGQTRKAVRPNLTRIRKYALPIVLTMTSFALLLNLDIIVAKHVFLPSEAGVFAAVSLLAKTPVFLSVLVSALMFAKVARLHVNGKSGSRLLQYAVILVGSVSVVLTLAFLFFSHPILEFVFGTQYALGPIVGFYVFAMGMAALALLLLSYSLAVSKHAASFALPLFVIALLALLALLHNSTVQIMLVVMFVMTLLAAYSIYMTRETLEFDYFI